MNRSTSQGSTYSRYVGRVVALAAAMGIGVMVATAPAVASADSTIASPSAGTSSIAGESAAPDPAGGVAQVTATGTGDIGSTTPTVTVPDPVEEPPADPVEQAPAAPFEEAPAAPVEQVPVPANPVGQTPSYTQPVAPAPTADEDKPTSTPEAARPPGAKPAEDKLITYPDAPAVDGPAAPDSDDDFIPVAPVAATQLADVANSPTAGGSQGQGTPLPAAVVPAPAPGLAGYLNNFVTKLLDPFLEQAPDTGSPFTPAAWALLAFVRRDLFNQAPTIGQTTTTVQTGQTVTGNIGAIDAEGDALTYRVTRGPEHGTVTIDQATGNYKYTPDDIDYDSVQTDSFTVTVSDGKFNVLSLFKPHTAQTDVEVDVLSPAVERVILDLPDGYTDPNTPRYAADGKSIYFSVTPPGGTRTDIHRINVDGTGFTCITCGLSPNVTAGLRRVSPYLDGSENLMIRAEDRYYVYEAETNLLIPVITPASAARAIDPQREMRISPDGEYVLFSQVQLGNAGLLTAVPVVGKIVRATDATGNPEYHIEDARVIYGVGEGKQFTPDGKGVIIIGGQYEAGNVDDVIVDLATGKVTRLTANLDYDEDTDLSPNQQWIAIGSARGVDALTPMTRIVRPAFLPSQIQGAVYEAYAGSAFGNVTNQEWVLAIEDELKGENGIPLFVNDDPNTPEDEGDNYSARSMASWNNTGDAVAFWEASPTDSRLVIANLKYTTSVGPVQGDLATPNPSWAPKLSEYIPSPSPLPAAGSYAGAGGGTALVEEVADPSTPGSMLRTVTYTNYVNEDGLILNGTESTSAPSSQNVIRYKADIVVTGAQTGYLTGDVTINKLTRAITPTTPATGSTPSSMITSSLDGDVLVLLDPARIADARADV